VWISDSKKSCKVINRHRLIRDDVSTDRKKEILSVWESNPAFARSMTGACTNRYTNRELVHMDGRCLLDDNEELKTTIRAHGVRENHRFLETAQPVSLE
jgi:hypothetical protein